LSAETVIDKVCETLSQQEVTEDPLFAWVDIPFHSSHGVESIHELAHNNSECDDDVDMNALQMLDNSLERVFEACPEDTLFVTVCQGDISILRYMLAQKQR
jgi:hypothetical protein